MARLKEGILGPGSGKVGNIVMYSRYGVNIIRCVPNKKPKQTPARLAQRQKMGLVHDFLRPAKELLHKSFRNDVRTRSPYQAAQSYHLKNAIAGEYPDQFIDMSKALVSKGDIPLPNSISFTASIEGVRITWDKKLTSPNGSNSDMLIMMWKNNINEYVDHIAVGATRSDGEFLWNKINSENLHKTTIWIAFRNREETDFSNSYCLHCTL